MGYAWLAWLGLGLMLGLGIVVYLHSKNGSMYFIPSDISGCKHVTGSTLSVHTSVFAEYAWLAWGLMLGLGVCMASIELGLMLGLGVYAWLA